MWFLLSLIPVLIQLARISVLWTILSAEINAGSSGICPGSIAFSQQLSRSAPLSTSLLSAILLPPLWFMSYTCLLIPEVRKKNTIVVPCHSALQFVRLPPSFWHHAAVAWAQSRSSACAKHTSTVSSSWLFTRRNSDCCLLRLTFSPCEIFADAGLFRGSPWAPTMVIPIASLPRAATSTLAICYSPGTQAFTLGYSNLRMRIMRGGKWFPKEQKRDSGCIFATSDVFAL